MKSLTLGITVGITVLLAALGATVAAPGESLDKLPHPVFYSDDIDCAGVESICNWDNTDLMESTETVCAEFRIWHTSHCVFESKKCALKAEDYRHVGMCNLPRKHSIWTVKQHRHEMWTSSCYTSWCPNKDELLCTVFQKEYENECRLLKDWCDNLKTEESHEIFKIDNGKCSSWDAEKSMFGPAHNATHSYFRNAHEGKTQHDTRPSHF